VTPARFTHRYRILALTFAGSAALHAAVMVGVPASHARENDGKPDTGYSATLDEGPATEPASAPVAKPAPPRPHRPRRAAPLLPPEPLMDPIAFEPLASALAQPVEEPEIAAPEPAKPDVVAIAQPAVPVKALEAPKFRSDALPSQLTIDYALTSAMADGHAVYSWSRDGDNYRITGEAEAIGFFTLFLEGHVVQESRGIVTPQGLRPTSFTERKPSSPNEGLEFDWDSRTVTFDRHGEKTTEPLADNVVDWLSMLFQTAANPPPATSDDYPLLVLTQRKFYRFHLKVLGEEQIEIPLGNVRTLHLRHVDEKDPTEVVDVWLGLEQSYLPVKLRYPVARNRLMVEQVATSVSSR
jgi:hypothetical protein